MAKFANDIKESLKQAIEHAEGKRELRTTKLAEIPRKRTNSEIRALRDKLRCSQAVFARALNVSVKTYQAWEQGTREPSGSALKLLAIAEINPEVILN